jgi:KDO2-lipid IV(A) lauroyltransferase
MYFRIIKLKLKIFLTKTFISLLALFSLRNNHRLGSVIGWLLSIFPNRNLHVTTTNIQLCFPEMDKQHQQQLIKKSLIEMGKTLTEASPMWQWGKDKLFKLIKEVHGEALIQQAINNQQGVILALPHLGNWELLGLYCSAKYSTTSMYQKPKMAQLDSIVKKGRERFGAKLVPTDNQGIRAMLKALKKNELICILPDQEPSEGNGIFAPFFGLQAYSMTLISRLASKTNAKVIVAYTKRLTDGQGYEIIFSEPDKMDIDSLEDSVADLNAELEKCIHDIPEQYQWSYKRFRKQPAIKDKRITGKDYYNS